MPDDISDEDKALFRRMMENVKPLKPTKKVTEKVKPTTFSPKKTVATPHQSSNTYYLSNNYQEIVSAEAILSYSKEGFPRHRLNQLKTGQIPWQARLDLHGHKPETACESLCHFIDEQYHHAHRCLLIIHGKGGLRGEAPILKNHVNHWLQQLPHILAFHSALPRDGGTGALYVLLKRQR